MSATPSATGAAAGPERLDRATLVVAGVIVLGAVMSILDATVVNVALRTLARDLHASLSTIQWVVSGYTLALASVIPLSGWLADRYGAKRVWLAAVAAFTAGSVLCATAWSAGSLIAFRLVQGVGGGILTPVGTTIIARRAGPQRMGQVMSVVGIPTLLGPVLGPVVGGALLQGASWRWIFLINVPIGAATIALGLRLLPAMAPQRSQRLDVAGVLLLSPGLAGIVFALSSTHAASDVGSVKVLVSLLAGLALIAAFVMRSRRIDAPLIDLSLFTGRTFSAAALTTFSMGIAVFGAALLVPLYFQEVRGEGVLATGLLTTPQALGMGAAMSVSGRLADRIGAGRVVPVGLLVLVGAFLALTTIGAHTSYVAIGAMLAGVGLGMGATVMPAMSAAYSVLDDAGVARATTALQIIQRVGSSVGAALFAVIVQQRLRHALPPTPGAAAGAFAGTYWWGVVLAALALVPAALLPRKHRTHPAARADCQPLAGNTATALAHATS